jgi:pimeloyl-ACP methyl ester carboxylesterase
VDVLTDQGTRVALHDLGGDGEPLLICHATGFCGRAYEPLAAVLGARHHVYAVDLRGHGDSPPPPDLDFDWRHIVSDVHAAVRAIGAGPVHGFGHSMGGAVALQAEATYGGLFATAFLYEPIVVPPEWTMANRNAMAAAARKRVETFPSKEAALWRYAARSQLGGLTAAALAAYVDHGFDAVADGSIHLKCRPEWEARTFEATGSITTESVSKVSIPVVVATGDEPDSPLVALAPGIVDAIAGARHIVYDGAGHFGPLQPPRRIARDLFELTGAAESSPDSANGPPGIGPSLTTS